MSECIDVSLTQRNWLGENIIASSNQIDEEDFVILDHTEDSFIVVACLAWVEVDDHSHRGQWFDDSFSHREGKCIALVSNELERCWQVTRVNHIQKSVGLCLHLNFTETDRL